MKRVAILQSNYIPWKGYFDLIAHVDEFIIYDDMQFTKNDWRNRNKIKTPQGLNWLTIPVGQNISRRICDVTIENEAWQAKHWKSLVANYGRAEFFEEIASWLRPLFTEVRYASLSEVNRCFIEAICGYLGIETKISSSRDYDLIEGKTERLVSLCQQSGAAEYVSGPAARDYLDERIFHDQRLSVSWFSYNGYPEYPQLWGGFEHGVSILDLLLNCGPNSNIWMKSVRKSPEASSL